MVSTSLHSGQIGKPCGPYLMHVEWHTVHGPYHAGFMLWPVGCGGCVGGSALRIGRLSLMWLCQPLGIQCSAKPTVSLLDRPPVLQHDATVDTVRVELAVMFA